MSRFELALPGQGLLVVGWDRPLQTFFGQVFPAGALAPCQDPGCWNKDAHVALDCRDDWPDPWVGTLLEELPTMERLREALGEYSPHLAPLIAELEAAREENV